MLTCSPHGSVELLSCHCTRDVLVHSPQNDVYVIVTLWNCLDRVMVLVQTGPQSE